MAYASTGVTGTLEMNGETISTIYEDAIFTMEQSLVTGKLSNVRIFDDRADDSERRGGRYPQIQMEDVGEYDVYENPQAFDIDNFASLTPVEKIGQGFLTDKRIRREGPAVRDNFARELGQAAARTMDSMILAGITDFTGGSLGSGGSAFKWGYIYAAAAILRDAGYEGPLEAVLHDFHVVDLGLAVAPGTTANYASENLRNQVESRGEYLTTVAGVDIYRSNKVPVSGTDAYSAVFAANALALDRRVDPLMETERNAKGRRWEFTLHGEWAAGCWEPEAGVKIIADITTPTGS